jgi:hypothetical protein
VAADVADLRITIKITLAARNGQDISEVGISGWSARGSRSHRYQSVIDETA